MSDKELDKLFQGEFDSFEVEPSAGLWDKIDAELAKAPAGKKKRAFPVLWMAAASIIVVMAAGIYFMQPTAKVQLHGKSDSQLAKSEETVEMGNTESDESSVQQNQSTGTAQQEQRKLLANLGEIRKTVNGYITHEHGRKAYENENFVPVPDEKRASNVLAASNALAAANTEAIEQVHSIAANTDNMNPTAVISQPDLTAINADVHEDVLPRRKIKSLGDLVNRVIATVDPREDKIIQFSDNDEGTEISGINLGLIKFKHNHNNK